MIHAYYVILGVIFALFVAQIKKLSFDHAKKSTFSVSGSALKEFSKAASLFILI